MEKFATFSGLVGLLFIILYIFCISILTADWLFSLFLKIEWYPQELLQKKENMHKKKLKKGNGNWKRIKNEPSQVLPVKSEKGKFISQSNQEARETW